MKKDKGFYKKMNLPFIIVFLAIISALIFWTLVVPFIASVIETNPQIEAENLVGCVQGDIITLHLRELDSERIDGEVSDWYIDSRELSEYYAVKLCREILPTRLKETLNKSKNLRLEVYYARLGVNLGFNELTCEYAILWETLTDSRYTTKEVERGYEIVSGVDLFIAQEEMPPRFRLGSINRLSQ